MAHIRGKSTTHLLYIHFEASFGLPKCERRCCGATATRYERTCGKRLVFLCKSMLAVRMWNSQTSRAESSTVTASCPMLQLIHEKSNRWVDPWPLGTLP